MAEQNRLARELESRETTQRKRGWTRPTLLPDPEPQDGWKFRWIRTSITGQADPMNVASKLREMWEPAKAEDHPELQMFVDPMSNSRFKGNIEVGGLMLCKAPLEAVAERNAHFAKETANQVESVDSTFMRQSDSRMPFFKERKSSVSFGRGTT
jgi:hypothetical protein